MSDGNPTFWQRFILELREYLFISFYLWICFGSLMLYKSAILTTQGLQALPLGLALVKALVMGKFILIGQAMRVGTRLQTSIVLHRIAWKTLSMLVLLVVFTIIEELVVGLVHHKTMAHTLSEFAAKPWLETAAPVVIMLLVLIPLIGFEEVDQALGKGKLRRTLFGYPDP